MVWCSEVEHCGICSSNIRVISVFADYSSSILSYCLNPIKLSECTFEFFNLNNGLKFKCFYLKLKGDPINQCFSSRMAPPHRRYFGNYLKSFTDT